MYTLTKNLKFIPILLLILGIVGIAIGFSSAPHTIEEVKELLHDSHGDGHGNSHHEVAVKDSHSGSHHEVSSSHDSHDSDAHYEHILHQLHNKPWASLYVAALFFFIISLGVLAFYAIQFVSYAGWSPLLFRVMEAITAYLLPGGIIVFLILVASVLHWNHLFVWMDPELLDVTSDKYDALIAGKSGWLNGSFFLVRAAIYLFFWNLYRKYAVKFSKNQDAEPSGNVWYKKSFKYSAAFLVFFIYSESMMSWDWIMSVDPHWFSTLFGWYVFASMFVSGITVIALVTILLKSQGYLPAVNNSHIHDLAKFMFGISVFWTYLWFSQFLLIWYSNIPEEVTYFITRINDYKLPFFGMIVLNFLFPVLLLINSDYKRLNWLVVMAGFIILFGHYVDVFNMIMPATVGASWSFGVSEIGALLFFLGLFMFVVFRALTKTELEPTGNPLLEESKHFHY